MSYSASDFEGMNIEDIEDISDEEISQGSSSNHMDYIKRTMKNNLKSPQDELRDKKLKLSKEHIIIGLILIMVFK